MPDASEEFAKTVVERLKKRQHVSAVEIVNFALNNPKIDRALIYSDVVDAIRREGLDERNEHARVLKGRVMDSLRTVLGQGTALQREALAKRLEITKQARTGQVQALFQIQNQLPKKRAKLSGQERYDRLREKAKRYAASDKGRASAKRKREYDSGRALGSLASLFQAFRNAGLSEKQAKFFAKKGFDAQVHKTQRIGMEKASIAFRIVTNPMEERVLKKKRR